jgi:hypothetical protein
MGNSSHLLFDAVFDDGANLQVGPDLKAWTSSSGWPGDFLTEGALDTLGVE